MTIEVETQVTKIKRLLDRELDQRLGAFYGCWPFLVAVAGLVLGVVLLVKSR